MPRRSKVELSPETISELEEQFYNFLHSLSPEETNKFFKEFLTTEEKMMMYKRLALYWSLFEGYSLASIQRMLGITHDTTRIYNKRKNEMSPDFKNLLHRIGRDGNRQPLKEAVVEEKHEEKIEDQEVKEVDEKTQDEPVVEVESQEETQEEISEEKIETQESENREEMEPEQEEEKIETQSEESESKNEESNEEENENPEKKKKGFGRFFGF